jgi:catechol 2,3-dioxygenase-like lactoylglutathione lyase family enzyme
MSDPPAIVGFDHVVLRVADTRRSVQWYHDQLGLEVLRFDEWERGEVFFVSVRIDDSTIVDLLETPSGDQSLMTTGTVGPAAVGNLDHLCLVLDGSTDLVALAAGGRFDVLEGPVERWGARGMGTSVYVRDPDGITIELRAYPSRSAAGSDSGE